MLNLEALEGKPTLARMIREPDWAEGLLEGTYFCDRSEFRDTLRDILREFELVSFVGADRNDHLRSYAAVRRFFERLRAAQESDADRATVDRLLRVVDHVGVQIADLIPYCSLDPLRHQLTASDRDNTDSAGASGEQIRRAFGCAFPLSVHVEGIRGCIANREGGYSPVTTPRVAQIMDALDRDDGEKPTAITARNIGGTNFQKTDARVTGRETVLDCTSYDAAPLGEMKTVPLTAEQFWGLFFTDSDIASMAAQHAQAETDGGNYVVAVGLAVPMDIVRGNDGFDDGVVQHLSDKFYCDELGPRNAADIEAWKTRTGGDRPESLCMSLWSFLISKNPALGDIKIAIGRNDTHETLIAGSADPALAGKRNPAGLIDGTGFNVGSKDDTNHEFGHIKAPFMPMASIMDHITSAQKGGDLDAECFCSGKQLNSVFLNTIRFVAPQTLVTKLEAIDDVARDQLLFRFAYGGTVESVHGAYTASDLAILTPLAKRLVERAEVSLAHLLIALHLEKGVDAIVGDGSYIVKEHQFRKNVNRRIQEATGLRNMIHIVQPVIREEGEWRGGEPRSVPASLAGLLRDAHGQQLLEHSA